MTNSRKRGANAMRVPRHQCGLPRLGCCLGSRWAYGRRCRGGTLQPSQARQAPSPFSAWELPEQAIRWCLAEGGLIPEDLDAVAYSYDQPWSIRRQVVWTPRGRTCGPRTRHARRSSCRPLCPATRRTSTSSGITWRTPHQPRWRHPGVHGSLADCAVLAVDGRGEATSMLAGSIGTASWISSEPNRCRTRSACCTRI